MPAKKSIILMSVLFIVFTCSGLSILSAGKMAAKVRKADSLVAATRTNDLSTFGDNPQKEYGYRSGQLLVTAHAPPQAPNGYTYQRTLTIDHTKVPNTDQTNFPLLISGTYSYLATVANGGNVQNANGYDVIFTGVRSARRVYMKQRIRLICCWTAAR